MGGLVNHVTAGQLMAVTCSKPCVEKDSAATSGPSRRECRNQGRRSPGDALKLSPKDEKETVW